MLIIDNIDQYKDSWTKELIKNSIDFELSTASWQGVDVFVNYDEDQALKNLSNDYDFAIVVSIGFIVGHNDSFYDHLKKFCSEKDFLIAGHILDNKEAYYEIHNQCYVINLKKYKDLNYPEIGKQSFHSSHHQLIPLRSNENFHDDYTPLWIRSGTISKKYSHKCHGWNIISKGLESDHNVITFDDNLRSLKTYFYPDDKEIINRLYIEHDIAAMSWVNAFGTSDYSVLGDKLEGNLKYLVTPCIGIDFIKFLAYHGFDENTVVRFVDYNLLSLEFTKRLVEWDGKDYLLFLENFGIEKTNFLNVDKDLWYGKSRLDQKWTEIQRIYDWPKLWSDIKETVKFEFRFTDFLHLGNTSWLDHDLNSPRTLINFSNIFNYYPTSILHTLRYKVEMESKLISDIKEIAPEAYLLFDHRAWKGFKPYTKNSKRAQAKNIDLVEIKDLIKPSWHYGTDWT